MINCWGFLDALVVTIIQLPLQYRRRKSHTWFPTSPHTLRVRVEAVPVPSAASVPEARAALAAGIVVPLEDKFGTSAFLLGKLADVHSCRGRCG